MNHWKNVSMAVALAVGGVYAVGPAQGELLTNPGFEDTDTDGNQGDGWGSFGAAGFNAFFGPNGHASLFMDNPGNSGGVFQTGIAGVAGAEYTFTLTDVRIESNAAADLRFGLEFYQGDDATQISTNIVPISLAQTGDGLNFTMSGIAPSGTAFVRPIILFDNVTSTAGGQENAFVFEATLVPEPATAALLGLGGLAMLRRRVA
ncbi:MAG: PEP-CTERM sorting domain-containing protein [Planctomycetota bacterium]